MSDMGDSSAGNVTGDDNRRTLGEIALLRQAVAGQRAREQMQALETEWRVSEGKGGLRAAVGAVMFMAAVIAGAYLIINVNVLTGLVILAGGGVLAMLWLRRRDPAHEALGKRRFELEQQLPRPEVWRQIVAAFGELDSAGYERLLSERQQPTSGTGGEA